MNKLKIAEQPIATRRLFSPRFSVCLLSPKFFNFLSLTFSHLSLFFCVSPVLSISFLSLAVSPKYSLSLPLSLVVSVSISDNLIPLVPLVPCCVSLSADILIDQRASIGCEEFCLCSYLKCASVSTREKGKKSP